MARVGEHGQKLTYTNINKLFFQKISPTWLNTRMVEEYFQHQRGLGRVRNRNSQKK